MSRLLPAVAMPIAIASPLIAATSCCGVLCPCRKAPDNAPRPGVARSLDECLSLKQLPEIGFDPHGNGPVLLGVALTVGVQTLFPIPFDSAGVTDSNTKPIKHVYVKDNVLHGIVADKRLEGASWKQTVFKGSVRCSRSTNYPIEAIIEDARSGSDLDSPAPQPGKLRHVKDAWYYELKLRVRPTLNADTFITVPACAGSGWAVPIPGYVDDNGAHVAADARAITQATAPIAFGCDDRDVAKCLSASYSADTDKHPYHELFQACLRMMTADYVGTGYGTTLPGAAIDLWDGEIVKKGYQSVPNRGFEGAWTSQGALCIDHVRWPLEPPGYVAKWGNGADCSGEGVVVCDSRPGHSTCRKLPCCHSDDEAKEKASQQGIPLLFNESCTKHPCGEEVQVCKPASK